MGEWRSDGDGRKAPDRNRRVRVGHRIGRPRRGRGRYLGVHSGAPLGSTREEMENHRDSPPLQSPLSARAEGGRVPALPRGPARTARGTPTPARAASTAHPRSGGQPPASARVSVSSQSGGRGRSLVMGGAQSAASSLFLRPRPRGGAGCIYRRPQPRAHGWLSRSHCSLLSLDSGAMTVKTEAARGTLTYSKMRGMVAILIGECWKSTGLVDLCRSRRGNVRGL